MTDSTATGRSPAPRPPSDSRQGPTAVRRIVVGLERNALLVLLIAIATFFTLWPETALTFPSEANLRGLVGDQTVVGLMALAAIFPLIVGEFDLSIGQLVAFLAVVNGTLMARFELSLATSAAITLLCAATIGLLTGLAVARLKLSSLVITLASGTVMGGVVLWYTSGLSISAGLSPKLLEFGSGTLWGIPLPALLLIAVALVGWHVLERTPSGRHLRFIGSNREAARLVGVRIDRYVAATFVVSAVLCALAAIALTARNGAANPGDGPGLLFPAIAAAFLGATTVKPGEFNVLGTLVGVFFVAFAVSGLNLAGVEPWVQPVFYGTSLAIAVGMSAFFARRRERGGASETQ